MESARRRPGSKQEEGARLVLKKIRFENVFRPHESVENPVFANSSGLKSVFEIKQWQI